jgi:hypothetical protein
MRKLFLTISTILICANIFAQHNWTFNPDDYANSMHINGQAYIQGGIVNGINIEIGAFCGDECRGLAKTQGGSCTYSTFSLDIFSNSVDGEVIHFIVRDTDLNEYEVINTVIFSNGVSIGDDGNPFLWMDEWLYQSTDFIVFLVAESNAEAIIDLELKAIHLSISPDIDLSVLTPYFYIAPGAKAFVGETEQIPQENIVDFTNPQTYTVYGVDGLQADWTVYISHEPTSAFTSETDETTIFPTISEDGIFSLNISSTSVYYVTLLDGKQISSGIAEAGTSYLKISEPGIFVITIINSKRELTRFKIAVL